MEKDKSYELAEKGIEAKYRIMVQLIRDILIENNIITRDEFYDKLRTRVKNGSLDEELINEILKTI